MTYCEDCGATNEAGATICRMCSRTLLSNPGTARCGSCDQALGVGATFCSACGVAVYRSEAEPEAAGPSGGLELPKWLRGGQLEPRAESGATGTPRSMPPLPDGGLSAAMPGWLRQTKTDGRAGLASPVTTAEALIDTTRFVTESDLPDWLRQVAERDAATPTPAEDTPVIDVLDPFALIAEAPDAPAGRVSRLLGESPARETALTLPAWLARPREETRASDGGAAFADVVQAQAHPPTEVRSTVPVGSQTTTVPEAQSAPIPSHAATAVTPAAAARSRWLRPVLLVVTLLALAVLLYSVATGG